MRRVLVLLALACGLGLLVLPAGATPSASATVSIVVDESVAPGDGSTAAPPAGVASDEPVGTSDAVAVSPPASVPGTESVSVSDDVSVVPPVTIVVDESVSPDDAPSIVPPASVLAAETATVTDDVSIVATSAPTTTTVTAGPNPAVAGAPVQLQAAVTSTAGAVGSGSVTFEDGPTPLGPPVSVDATGHASLTVSTLGLGSHTIVAAYGGSAAFLSSSAMTSEGIYDYALAAGPDRTTLRGGDADYALTLSLDAGSATTGLPSNVPFSVGLLPGDASSNAPASIAFPQSPGSPTSLTVTVHAGAVTLGDVPLSFTAGARPATSGLHIYDYALALAPASQTVQRGDTASFTLTSSLALGSSSMGLPAAIGLTTSAGATAGALGAARVDHRDRPDGRVDARGGADGHGHRQSGCAHRERDAVRERPAGPERGRAVHGERGIGADAARLRRRHGGRDADVRLGSRRRRDRDRSEPDDHRSATAPPSSP